MTGVDLDWLLQNDPYWPQRSIRIFDRNFIIQFSRLAQFLNFDESFIWVILHTRKLHFCFWKSRKSADKLMTSSCFSSVHWLRIFWFLRIVLLKVEYSKQASRSKEKRKQEWSYQQCNLVWYQSEKISRILWNFFLLSTKLMWVLEQAY